MTFFLLLFIRAIFPAINNAREAIREMGDSIVPWKHFHPFLRREREYTPAHSRLRNFLSNRAPSRGGRDLERVPRLHRMQHLTHLSSSSRVTAWNHLHGAALRRDTLNNERNLLLFSFYFSTIRSNARAHAVWPREGEDREARGGEGRGGSKGVTF